MHENCWVPCARLHQAPRATSSLGLAQAVCLSRSTKTQASPMEYYRIIAEGEVAPVWRECLGGLDVIEHRQPGRPVITQLEGQIADQSALQGVINTLFMLGLRLTFVERRSQGTI